jgi:uncharacterized protein YhjY with autotransporter beta-barrel domain
MKLFLQSIVFLVAITALTPFASGQTLYWAGGPNSSASVGGASTTDTDFNTPGNWSTVPPNAFFGNTVLPQVVPSTTNIAIVEADLNNGTIRNDFFTNATAVPVVINQTKQGNTVQGLIISNEFVSGGIVTINNTAGHALTINGTGVTTGDFLVDGGVTLNYGGGPLAVTNGLIAIGDNADNTFFNNNGNTLGGSGTFNITSGTFTFDAAGTATSMIVANSQTGSGNTTSGNANGIVTQGSVANNTASLVTTGSSLIIGYNGGTGSWTLANGSTLQTGTLASSYLIALGSNAGPGPLNGTGGSGTLTIGSTTGDSGNFNFGTANSTTPTDLQLGTLNPTTTSGVITGGTGTITENGASIVNIAGEATTVEVGDADLGIGNYNLVNGTLNIGVNATDDVTFTLGAAAGSTGTLTQTAGTVTVGNSGTPNGTVFTIGGAGNGIYNMNGGTAIFNNALTLGATGTLNLNGGTFQVREDDLLGTGNIIFNGGTLKLTAGTTTTFTYDFNGSLLANTSTIDASTAGLTDFTFGNPLTGNGGISLIGDGATIFHFASELGGVGAANTYFGATSISHGTLNALGADIVNSSNVNIGTGGTLNLTLPMNGFAYGGALGGTGNLSINFNTTGDTFAIKSPGTFTGAIVLGANGTSGNFQVYSGSFGNISPNGTASTVTIGGALPGTITNPFVAPTSGTVTFLNPTYTGLTTVNTNFTLNSNDLDGSVVNYGTLNVTNGIAGDVTTNSGTITAGTISGDVTSNTGKITAGEVVGNLTNSIGGTYIANGAINTTSVGGMVTNNGTLMSSSPLVAVVAPPPNATFTIGGAFMQSANGTLSVRINGTTADYYQIGGAASFAGALAVTGSSALGVHQFVVADASGGVSGTLSTAPATALFSVQSVVIAGDTVTITTNQASIGTYAQTPNEQAVANALDNSGPSPIKTLLNQVTPGAAPSFFPSVLQQLTPESLQYARNISFENSTFLAQRVDGVAADLRSGYGGLDTSAISVVAPGFNSSLGRSLDSLLAYDDPSFHSSAPNGVNYYPGGGDNTSSPSSSSSSDESSTPPAWSSSHEVISDSSNNPYLANQNPSGPQAPAMNVFIAGDAVLASLNQNSTTSKASYTSGGATAGVAFRMSSNLAAGVLFDYNHTDAKTDSNGSKTDVDSYSPGLFATYFDHGFYANGLFSFGYNNYANKREVVGETASSHPAGQQYVGDLDLGYDFHPNKNWVVGPSVGLTYTHLDIDSFTESGAPGADLSVNEQNADSLRSRLGGHVIFQTNTGDVLLQPNITAMWQHEYLDSSSGITSSLPNTGDFTIQTNSPSRDSALIGVGMTATLSNSLALYLNYLADVGADDYWAQSVVGGFKARF